MVKNHYFVKQIELLFPDLYWSKNVITDFHSGRYGIGCHIGFRRRRVVAHFLIVGGDPVRIRQMSVVLMGCESV